MLEIKQVSTVNLDYAKCALAGCHGGFANCSEVVVVRLAKYSGISSFCCNFYHIDCAMKLRYMLNSLGED